MNIYQLVLFKMGNQTLNSFKQEYQIIKHPINSQNIYKHIPSQELYQQITITNPDPSYTDLIEKINHRNNHPFQYIQPIKQYAYQSQKTACGSSSKLILMLVHPFPTLWHHIRYRRIKGRTFHLDQILLVVKFACLGLKQIKNRGQQHGEVLLETIIVNKRIMIVDPLYLQRDDEQNFRKVSNKVRGFPSPQKLINNFDKLSNFQEYYADLFSVGIIALQMYFINNDMSMLYKNKNPTYCNNTIDTKILLSYLNLIKQPILKEIITFLVNFQTKKRTSVYMIVPNIQINNKNLKIFRQNPFAIRSEDYLMEEINSLDYSIKDSSIPNINMPLHHKGIKVESAPITNPNTTQQTLNTHEQKIKISENQAFTAINSFKLAQINHYPIEKVSIDDRSLVFNRMEQGNIYNNNNFRNNSLINPSSVIHNTSINHPHQQHPISHRNQSVGYPNSQTKIQQPQFSYQVLNFNHSNSNHHKPSNLLHNPPRVINEPQFGIKNLDEQRLPIKQQQQNHLNSFNFIKHDKHNIKGEGYSSMNGKYQNIDQTLKRLQQNMKVLISTTHKSDSSAIPYDIHQPKINNKSSTEQIPPQTYIQNNRNKNKMKQQQYLRANMVNYSIIQQPSLQNSYTAEPGEEYIVEQYETGARYQGYKRNGMRNGVGKFYYTEKSMYNGEWRDNKMDGFGVLTYSSGTIAYEGYWKNDSFHGKGIIYNENPENLQNGFDYKDMNRIGDYWKTYEGESSQGKKQGHGRLTLTNGQTYQGEFLYDFVHGEGIFMRSDGFQVRGLWKEGLLLDLQYLLQQSIS